MDGTEGHHADGDEIARDAVHDTLDAAATAVETVAAVVVAAVRDIGRAVGDFGTEVFEIRESVRSARHDAEQ